MAMNDSYRYGRTHLVAGLLALLVGLTACSGNRPSTNKGGYVSGDGSLTRVAPADRKPAPALKGEDLYGKPLSAAQFKGSVIVVNIWGSWCPPCRKETPVLNKVATDLKPIGVQFLGIAVREGQASSRAFAERNKVPYPSISDGDSLLVGFSSSLPAIAIPTTFVIDRRGRVAARLLDVATEVTLRDLVTEIAEEK